MSDEEEPKKGHTERSDTVGTRGWEDELCSRVFWISHDSVMVKQKDGAAARREMRCHS